MGLHVATLRGRAGLTLLLAVLLISGCETRPSSPTSPTPAALAATCLATARNAAPPRAVEMAFAAQREHAAWGGQAMDDHGRLIESGSSEAEDTPRSFGVRAPWQRVLHYWRAVDPHSNRLPYVVRYGALRRADRQVLQDELTRLAAPWSRETPMGDGLQQGLAPDTLRPLQVALKRVAVVDTPWSAAFISWLAREVGLESHEFTFSEAHADYAAAAWRAGAAEAAGLATPQALRACNIEQTPPRIGDLICHTRGDAAPNGFRAVVEALEASASSGQALPMHCDIVVGVDGRSFDTIGGNLLQSVTRRRMAFVSGELVLDVSYFTWRCAEIRDGCVDRHMSRAPWALLLQWR